MQKAAAPIYLLSGSPGAGKSTVANALLQHFAFGLHLPVDDLRDWVVSGIAHPGLTDNPETTRQFLLARTAAAQTARLYAENGFTVVVDDVLWPTDLQFFLPLWAGLDLYPVMLAPGLEVAQQRNAQRTSKAFDPSTLIPLIDALAPAFRLEDFQAAGWKVIENGNQTVEETVAAIVALS